MATVKRYEVWATFTGSASDWKIIPQGIYVGGSADNDINKQRALERADLMSSMFVKVCVEEYDDGRNQYLRTVRELPLK